ncbi:NAD-dependent epimerase/dehydratase family protein [Nonomuraea basaltis]|uniref:NAD-dependent epimerase/dehydratase family protein n=1 Tax=Nonomuraea basaltis TaxID=2495887 RepID=UPI00110C53BA|nr:NAD-dependent epimerase/dehydratase family protein [Nonomuraea basaltis]TMR94408.1 reductase [Nonomuraea basaltis]
MNNVCVIGGSRYFGRRLIESLRDSGARVTVINRGSVPPPPGITHLTADRDDEKALGAAVGNREFDAVIDQVCYTPYQAAIARRVFGRRTSRYVMTSTMEVYDPATSELIPPAVPEVPVTEEAVDPASWPVPPGQPWHDPGRMEGVFGEATRYAEGKRQAEAVFTRESPFAFVTVRSAHVLGIGARDFTGRLEHYVERILAGRPVDVHRDRFPTSFINDEEIAGLLFWAAGAEFTGAVNASSHGELSVTGLCDLIAAETGRKADYRLVDGGEASPFSFDRHYAMGNGRAARLGYAFSTTTDWLPKAIAMAIDLRKGT